MHSQFPHGRERRLRGLERQAVEQSGSRHWGKDVTILPAKASSEREQETAPAKFGCTGLEGAEVHLLIGTRKWQSLGAYSYNAMYVERGLETLFSIGLSWEKHSVFSFPVRTWKFCWDWERGRGRCDYRVPDRNATKWGLRKQWPGSHGSRQVSGTRWPLLKTRQDPSSHLTQTCPDSSRVQTPCLTVPRLWDHTVKTQSLELRCLTWVRKWEKLHRLKTEILSLLCINYD